ncbi:hypothetical protein BDZ45DRAFT_749435 [Acephala macrosclerotiorum]|nr:hypothetical protein BDZ45DRAFT_749435 [Acephala macrosclerotiorum]
MASMYDSKDNSMLNGIIDSSSRPNMQRQDSNQDLHSFFNDTNIAPSSLTNQMSWNMDQIFDFNCGSEFPFPGNQPNPFAFAPAQAPAPFMTGLTPQNMIAMNNGRLPSAGELAGQTAAPSALFNSTNTPSGYNTRQATGSQKRSLDSTSESTEATEEPAPKKPRKTRKKRSKEMSKEEQEEKRQKFLDRNKQAAHKCRQRKKEWTDNLQNKANLLQHENNILEMQKAQVLVELEMIKMVARQCPPGCSQHERIVAVLNEIDARPQDFWKQRGEEILTARKEAMRNASATPDLHSRAQSQAMSRGGSAQSAQSTQSYRSESQPQETRTERLDSGISNMSTPESGNKLVLSRRLSKQSDEGVDVGNGQHFYMLPNQRLGGTYPQQWSHGMATKPEPAADLPGMDEYFASLGA